MLHTTLYPFQLIGVKKIQRLNGRVLLADSMGMGKTVQALAHVDRHPELRPVVVVCPASLKWVWEREAKVHIGLRAEVLEGTRPKGHRIRPAGMYIINYDILHAWLDWLKALSPQIVVADEIHYAKEKESRRSRALAELCLGVPHVLGLTGTPIENRPIELWHPLYIIRPDLFPNWRAFAQRYCRPRRTPWGGWDFSGASHLDELNSILRKQVMIRRRKEDVLAELPAKRRQVIPVDITNRADYNHAFRDFIGWLKKYAPSKWWRKAARAQAIVQMGHLLRLAAKGKLPAVYEWVDNFLQSGNDKLVLFASHRKVIARLNERYAGLSVVVDGSVVGRKRQQAFDQFLLTKRTQILVGNIKAAGLGWSGRGVSDLGFVEFGWTPGGLSQAEDRIHGLGRGVKGRRSHIRLFVARGTIEEKLLAMLDKKSAVANQAIDGGNGQAYDLAEQLARELLREHVK